MLSETFDQKTGDDLPPVLDLTMAGGGDSTQLLRQFMKNQDANPEHTGGSVRYYTVEITHPTTESNPPYTAECNDIIEALGMNYAEGNAFKAIWRRNAAKVLGKVKQGYTDGLYDAQKVEFFGKRMVAQEQRA